MIVTIKNVSISKIREARYTLVSRNVLPAEEFNFPDSSTDKYNPSFVGYLALCGHRDFMRLADQFLTPREQQKVKESRMIEIQTIKIYYTEAFETGAVVWGNRPNPIETVEID